MSFSPMYAVSDVSFCEQNPQRTLEPDRNSQSTSYTVFIASVFKGNEGVTLAFYDNLQDKWDSY